MASGSLLLTVVAPRTPRHMMGGWGTAVVGHNFSYLLNKKKTRPLRGRVFLSLVLLSGFFSAQGVFLSHGRRGAC
ncbi:MAG: hypothetical protein M5U34_41570 [Chloroflexi bacterium]|nr:hypothetical protein [Chloroflexota bacterium]